MNEIKAFFKNICKLSRDYDVATFIKNGYIDLKSFKNLKDDDLENCGISDSMDRQKILMNLKRI